MCLMILASTAIRFLGDIIGALLNPEIHDYVIAKKNKCTYY